MKVAEGSNYTGIQTATRSFLMARASAYTVLMEQGDQRVVYRCWPNSTVYYLCQVRSTEGRLNRDLYSAVIGCIVVEHDPTDLDLIDIVWTDERWRGKGYGLGLHVLAYNQSVRGILSSTNIGTMELRTLLSMYRQNPAVTLWYEHDDTDLKVPRSQVDMTDGLKWLKLDLCSPDTGAFYFEWHKPLIS